MRQIGKKGNGPASKAGLWPLCAVAVLVLAVFLPSLRYDFLFYDDDTMTILNPYVKDLSGAGIARMFSRFWLTSYYPVRQLSFAFDYGFWVLNPFGYRLTNLLLHLANMLLTGLLAARLAVIEKARDPVLFAYGSAAVLGLHPLVVEPVVWIAGREELLLLFFSLGSAHLFMSAAWRRPRGSLPEQRKAHRTCAWLLALVCCVLACLSNVVGAVLPFLLLALGVHVGRLAGRRTREALTESLGRLWPLAVVALAAVLVKVFGPGGVVHGSGTDPDMTLSVPRRVLTVAAVYWFNVRSVLWPAGLTLCYPNTSPSSPLELPVLLGVLTAGCTVWLAHRHCARESIVGLGLLWWLIALVPSSQMLPHHVYRADRFLYLALVGISLVVGAALSRSILALRARRPVWPAAAALVLLMLWGTGCQVRRWRTELALFSRAVLLYPRSATAQRSLGEALARRGRLEEAVARFRESDRLRPNNAMALNNLGNALKRLGRLQEAVAAFEKALRSHPDDLLIYVNLGGTLTELGRYEEARNRLEKALALAPSDAGAHANMGMLLLQQGQFEQALQHYLRAAPELQGQNAFHYGIGRALVALGRPEEALAHFRAAIRRAPGDTDARRHLAAALNATGRTREALAIFRAVADANTESASDQYNLGTAYLMIGNDRAAIGAYSNALALRPNHAPTRHQLGVALLRAGSIQAARGEWARTLAVDPDYAPAHDDLGRLLLEMHSPTQAVAHLLAALRLDREYALAYAMLARRLAAEPDDAFRNGAAALKLAQAACDAVNDGHPAALDALGMAYAETGDFAKAIEAATRAAGLARLLGNKRQASLIATHVRLYQQRKPYRLAADDTRR